MAEASLLPDNATPFERAQSEADATRWPLPTHLISDLWNPATCPLELLPYLAAGLGLEIWHDDWDEATKRAIVADIWRLKRNKTKLKGIGAYLALENAKLVGAHRPRDKRWWSGGQTEAQRAAATAAMPQIHIALEAATVSGLPAKAFWSGHARLAAWSSARAWTNSDAAARYAARATYVDQGVSTPVTVHGIDGVLDASLQVELAAPASVGKLFWSRRQAWGQAAFLASDAADHILAVTPDQSAPAFAIPAGLQPTTARPVRVAETVAARPGQRFWGGGGRGGLSWGGGYGVFVASDAASHTYDRVTLFDPTRLVASRQPFSFWGWSRFGRPAYTAEIRVDVALERPPLQQGYGRPWGRNFWRRSDLGPLWRAIAAVRTARAFRDTIYVDTRLYEPIVFSPGLRFGEAGFMQFGDTKRLQ